MPGPLPQLLEQFHFLRPEFLWALPVVALVWWLLRRKKAASASWGQILPPEFLQALATGSGKSSRHHPMSLWPLILGLTIFALAGPTWYQDERPAGLRADPVVVVFDLSLSMLSTDQAPNRLTRARQKLYDLIEYRQEGQTGLVTFAGSAHIVSPLTEDITTLRGVIPALDPFIMPELGSHAAAGVSKAVDALAQAGSRGGRILLITDGIEPQDVDTIRSSLQGTGITLSVIGVGSADGGPIPIPNRGFIKQNNEIVVAKPDFDLMQTVAAQNGGRFIRLSLDDRDLRITLPDKDSEYRDGDAIGVATDWHDAGYWLLLPVVLLVLIQYRQAGVTLTLILLVALPDKSYALEWRDLWESPDQQGQRAYDQQKYNDAATLFEDPLRQGLAYYQAGNFEQAAEAFSRADSAEGAFNLGNALVEQEQLEQAIAAYEEALTKNPDFRAARENKEKLEDYLKQQQEQKLDQQQQSEDSQNGESGQQSDSQQQDQDQSAEDSGQNQSSGNQQNDSGQQQAGGDPQSANKRNPGSAQQNPDQNGSQNQTDSQTESGSEQPSGTGASPSSDDLQQKQSDEQSLASQRAQAGDSDKENEPSTGAAALSDEASLKDQQTEQWLRRIPDDPGGLLRRKFLQQYQEEREANGQRGNGSGTIW